MAGMCFEAAHSLSGRVFILRNMAELNHLYDLADQTGACGEPTIRKAFDFSGGRVLAGLWGAGRGCDSRFDVLNIQRDDSAHTFTLQLRHVIEGDCDYDLLEPFWIGLDNMINYQIAIEIE